MKYKSADAASYFEEHHQDYNASNLACYLLTSVTTRPRAIGSLLHCPRPVTTYMNPEKSCIESTVQSMAGYPEISCIESIAWSKVCYHINLGES